MTPEGKLISGTAMLPHAYCNGGLRMERALILTIVANVVCIAGWDEELVKGRAVQKGGNGVGM